MQSPGKVLSFLRSQVFWVVLLSLIWVVVFRLNWLPILRGTSDWRWLFRPVQSLNRILPLMLVIGLYVPVGLWLRGRRSTVGLLVWATLGGICLSLAAVYVRGDVLFRLYSITASGRAEGWQIAAVQIQSLAVTLRNWPQFMAQSEAYSPHIDHTPPGIVIIYYLVGRALDQFPGLAHSLAEPLRWQLCQDVIGYTDGQYSSAWLGITVPLWASLTVIPLYHLGRRVYGEEAARWSALWWPLVPSILVFVPLPNTLYPLTSLLVIGMLWEGLSRNRPAWILAAGFLMSILTFLTLTFLPLLLFAGLLALGAYWQKVRDPAAIRPRWFWPIQMGLLFAIGLSVVWLIAYATAGLSIGQLLLSAQQTQVDIAGFRPYLPWLTLNLNDYLMFTGWPIGLLAALGIWSAIRALRSKEIPPDDVIMTSALALTLILVDLSGTPRGEWGRIMSFLSPWLLLAAGRLLQNRPVSGWAVTVTQGIVAWVMVTSLLAITIEFRGRQAPVPPKLEAAAPAVPVYSGGAIFGSNIRLAAAFGQASQPEGDQQPALNLWFTWNTLKYVNVPYAYSVQPVTQDGVPVGPPVVVPPFADSYPMTCWRPGPAPLTDQIRVPLTAPTAARSSWVDLSVIDPSTGQPLAVQDNSGLPGYELQIGPIPAR